MKTKQDQVLERQGRKFTPGGVLYPLLALAIFVFCQGVAIFGAVLLNQAGHFGAPVRLDQVDQLMALAGHSGVLLVANLATVILISGLLYFLRHRAKPHLFKRIPQPRAWGLLPVLTFGLLGLTSLWQLLVHLLAQAFPFWQGAESRHAQVVNALSSGESVVIQILALAILTPLAEELVFRGVILNELRLWMNKYLAVAVTALVFGVFHGNLVQGIYATIIGVGIGLIYLWTESIWSAIFVHMVFNFFGGVVPSLLKLEANGQATTAGLVYTLVIYGLLLLSIPAAIWLYRGRRAAQTLARGSQAELAQAAGVSLTDPAAKASMEAVKASRLAEEAKRREAQAREKLEKAHKAAEAKQDAAQAQADRARAVHEQAQAQAQAQAHAQEEEREQAHEQAQAQERVQQAPVQKATVAAEQQPTEELPRTLQQDLTQDEVQPLVETLETRTYDAELEEASRIIQTHQLEQAQARQRDLDYIQALMASGQPADPAVAAEFPPHLIDPQQPSDEVKPS